MAVADIDFSEELFTSRTGDSDRRTLEYKVVGDTGTEISDIDVLDYMEANTSSVYDGMNRGPIEIELITRIPVDVWIARVPYQRRGEREQNPDTPIGRKSRTYNTTTQSQKILFSRQTLSITPAFIPGTAKAEKQRVYQNHNGINLDSKTREPQGVDIAIPTSTLSINYTFDKAQLTPTYIAKVSAMVGLVNNATFEGFEPGEVLFTGFRVVEEPQSLTAWNSTTAYVVGNKVSHNTLNWIAVADNQNEEPGVEPSWSLVSQPSEVDIELTFAIETNDYESIDIGIDSNGDAILQIPENWLAQSYDEGTKVYHLGQPWIALQDAIAGDIPGTANDVWGDTTALDGWDILHVLYNAEYSNPDAGDETDKDGNVPICGYTERVYRRTDLNAVFVV